MFEKVKSQLEAIRAQRRQLTALDAKQLRSLSLTLKHRVASSSQIQKFIPEAFALVVEAAHRSIGMEHYDMQLIAGITMSKLRIAEMRTGEGKTLTATLPSYLYALAGKGVHVATANDYLAGRDAELMSPVYEALGLSVGVVTDGNDPTARQAAYACDITYGTTKEIGFDFLRDRLNALKGKSLGRQSSHQVMRPLFFILVDEADNNLIDEASTPLIIGTTNESQRKVQEVCARWAASHAESFKESVDYRIQPKNRMIQLVPRGMQLARSLMDHANLPQLSVRDLYRSLETAIKVRRDFRRDEQYTVQDDQIVIIDQFTGRAAEGRQWQRGIHQAVEAKEGLPISPETKQAAAITVQTLCKRYPFFTGMTGTAWTSRREFKKVYKKKVVRIPTRKPIDRQQWPVKIFAKADHKWDAVACEVQELIDSGRAVLIGTRTLEQSELLSTYLRDCRIDHEVLNARQFAREAEIVEMAGQSGRVTVATNMAGRGTDIKLGDDVAESGGLHVILTEMHESQRIDWQLIGRGSRQGDPGSYRIFLSLEDELLRIGFGDRRQRRILDKSANSELLSTRMIRLFRKAQNRIERRHLVDRLVLMRREKDRQKHQIEMGQDPFLAPA